MYMWLVERQKQQNASFWVSKFFFLTVRARTIVAKIHTHVYIKQARYPVENERQLNRFSKIKI
jgi:hypothetical protein